MICTVGFYPIPYTFSKTAAIPFTTSQEDSGDLELGDSKVSVEEVEGLKVVEVAAQRSLFGMLFRWEPQNQTEKSSVVTKKPVEKVVVNGTKKYQYMLCSDGSYRYYTDDQFKDPKTGFTSKSEDYCKKNGQGEKVRLSDTASGASNSSRNPTVTVRDGCTYTSIPYKTVYKDVAWLNKGETRVYGGSDGIKSSCGWSTDPIDKEVLRGASDPSSGSSPGVSNTQDVTAYYQCLSAYQSAMSQIQANISQGHGGQDALKRQVESEFSRCKRDAGF